MIYHIIRREKGWALKRQGANKAMKIFGKKEDAVVMWHGFNFESKLVVHSFDGSVSQVFVNTY